MREYLQDKRFVFSAPCLVHPPSSRALRSQPGSAPALGHSVISGDRNLLQEPPVSLHSNLWAQSIPWCFSSCSTQPLWLLRAFQTLLHPLLPVLVHLCAWGCLSSPFSSHLLSLGGTEVLPSGLLYFFPPG